jgi:hypothetical protein
MSVQSTIVEPLEVYRSPCVPSQPRALTEVNWEPAYGGGKHQRKGINMSIDPHRTVIATKLMRTA